MKLNDLTNVPKNVRVNPDLLKELGTFTEKTAYVNELEINSLDILRCLTQNYLRLIGKREKRNFARDFGLQPKQNSKSNV